MQISPSTDTEIPTFAVAGRKLETFYLGGKPSRFILVERENEEEIESPAKAFTLSVAQRLHGDWYAEVDGKTFRVCATGDGAAQAITAAFAKVV